MMVNRYKILTAVLMLTAALTALSAPIDEARKLYRNGDYEAAVKQLQRIVKRSPRDGNANYYLGMSLRALGRTKDAQGPLTVAEDRGINAASEALAADAIDDYRLLAAERHLDTWEKDLEKRRKKVPESLEEMRSRLMQMKNMLDRVERIEIIDSIAVDSAEFFTAYHLSPAAGSILSSEMLSRIEMIENPGELGTAYLPQNHSELLWSAVDSNGKFQLYGADILDDGTMESMRMLDKQLAGGGNASYPFLMPDGVTLYFASDGEESIGGYDIFMTRRNDEGYYQPQNLGMPYNSPDNDFMLAIDEASGLGWFATDRNHIPGKVTVYVFAPSAMRVNADPNDRNLRSLAKLDNIALTRKKGVNYKAMLAERLPHDKVNSITAKSARFAIDMGNGKIYTAINDFKNAEARSTMVECLTAQSEVRNVVEELEQLRKRFAEGDEDTASDILDAEEELNMLRRKALALRNKAIRFETGKK